MILHLAKIWYNVVRVGENMKKKLLVLFILLLLATGCSAVRMDNKNFEDNIGLLLEEKAKNYNVYFEGYKYYVPVGLRFVNKEEYNAILADRYNNRYYLYVDAVAYYHKAKMNYSLEDDLFYDSRFSYNKKEGYIKIKEENDSYFIEFVYGYAKVEAYTKKGQLNDTIINICYILRSIKFNDTILESLIGENVLSYKEETFSLFDDEESSKEDFLGVVSKYDAEYSKAQDQDEIELYDDAEEVKQ